MSTTTAPRRTVAPWPIALALGVIIGIIIMSGPQLTWDVPITVAGPATSARELPVSEVERAQQLAAARQELRSLQAMARQAPSTRAAFEDRMALLTAVGAGHVPTAALQPAQ